MFDLVSGKVRGESRWRAEAGSQAARLETERAAVHKAIVAFVVRPTKQVLAKLRMGLLRVKTAGIRTRRPVPWHAQVARQAHETGNAEETDQHVINISSQVQKKIA